MFLLPGFVQILNSCDNVINPCFLQKNCVQSDRSTYLQQSDLVFLTQDEEAGDALGEVDNVADSRSEALGELFRDLGPIRGFRIRVEWARLVKKASLNFERQS